MPSYTTSLKLIQPSTGEYPGSWGTQVNTSLTALVDVAVAGTTTVTMTAANVTLTNADGVADQAKSMFLVLQGSPGASFAVIVPSASKLYFVTNSTGFAQTVRTSGTGISVPNGASMTLRCDGTNVVVAQNYFASLTLGSALPVASGGTGATTSTGSGAVVLATSPTLTDPIVTSLNTGQLAGMRNKIINGKMDVAQRGTSFAAIATNAYSLDRFFCTYISTAVVTVSQQSDVPSGNEFQNSLRVAVTTADTSIAASDVFHTSQGVEGYNARDLIGRTFSLSFWVRSSKTGTHCISFRNGSVDRSYVAEYTISAANTWEYKSVTVSGGLITAGTWNWTNGAGLYVGWALACGTTSQTTAGAWQTGSFIATSNQVNCLDSTSNIFAITGVQLEVGSVATPFEHRPYGAELALCQRYFELISTFAASNSGGNRTDTTNIKFSVTKRASPTVAIFGTPTTNTGINTIAGTQTDNVYLNGAGVYVGTLSASAEL